MHLIKNKLLAALVIGIIAFWVAVGPAILNPLNISWLEEGDLLTHYFGWAFLRDSMWTFPLGVNPKYGDNIALSIVFTDSIPLVAIPLKFLSGYLPENFQYFGLWTLLSFIIFVYTAFLVADIFTKNALKQISIALILLFSPPMLFRVGWHTALVSQFFILGAIYLNLERGAEFKNKTWNVLLIVSLLVNFYIFVMVYVLFIADLIDEIFEGRYTCKRGTHQFIIINCIILVVAWMTGYFVGGLSSASTIYYGGFGTNALSIFESHGWSYVLKNKLFYDYRGNWEDINFIGLGGIFLVVMAFCKFKTLIGFCRLSWEKFPVLIFAILAMALFSFTHKIGIGDLQINIPIPEGMQRAFGMLRNSGRFLWPAYYSLLVFLIYVVIKSYSPKKATMIFVGAALMQIVDTSSGWLPIRNHLAHQSSMLDAVSKNNNYLSDPLWVEFARHYKKINLIPLRDDHPQYFGWGEVVNWPLFSSFALRHHLGTNSIYFARANSGAIKRANDLSERSIANGQYDEETLYIVSDAKIIPILIGKNKGDALIRLNDVNILAPNWNNCELCPKVDPEKVISVFVPSTLNGVPIKFGRSGEGPKFLLDVGKYQQIGMGWSYPEEWGVWSNGSMARVVLPTPEEGADFIIFDLRALITKNYPAQKITVLINGDSSHQYSLTKDQNQIQIELPKDKVQKYIELEFSFPDAISPKEISLGSDDRKLSIGIEKITFIKRGSNFTSQ